MSPTFAGVPVDAFANKPSPAEIAEIVSKMSARERAGFLFELSEAIAKHLDARASIERTGKEIAELQRHYESRRASRFFESLLDGIDAAEAHQNRRAAE